MDGRRVQRKTIDDGIVRGISTTERSSYFYLRWESQDGIRVVFPSAGLSKVDLDVIVGIIDGMVGQ